MSAAPTPQRSAIEDFVRQAIAADPSALDAISELVESIRRSAQAPVAVTDVSALDAKYQWPALEPDENGKPRTLMPCQKIAIAWMDAHTKTAYQGMRGGIYSGEMGIGKTLAAITYAIMTPGEHLIVCNLGLLQSTMLFEVRKWYGNRVRAFLLHTDEPGFLAFRRGVFRIVITTYETVSILARAARVGKKQHGREVKKDRERRVTAGHFFDKTRPWASIFTDESQRIMTPKTDIFDAMCHIPSVARFALTGTPVRSSKMDLVAQLRWVGLNHGEAMTADMFTSMNLENFVLEHRLRDFVALPPIEESDVQVVFSPNEKFAYKLLLSRMQRISMARDATDTKSEKAKLSRDLREGFDDLRAACTAIGLSLRKEVRAAYVPGTMLRNVPGLAPDQVIPAETWMLSSDTTASLFSAKLNKLVEIVRNNMGGNEKALVFTIFPAVADLVSRRLAHEFGAHSCVTCSGNVDARSRDVLVHRFRQDPACRFLVGTAVMTEGFTLTEANHVFFMEVQQNYIMHRQGIKRMERIGQTRPMHVYNLVVRGSVEQFILEICRKREAQCLKILESIDTRTAGKLLEKSNRAMDDTSCEQG